MVGRRAEAQERLSCDAPHHAYSTAAPAPGPEGPVAHGEALVHDQDRRAGYFFGKDRRGQLHRVPLMTLSIGIVTNRSRKFTHPAQVSELATEMKSYAKTLPGSVFVMDRRHQSESDDPGDRRPGEAR